MPECFKCKNSIRGETGIRCAGVCGKVFHIAIKCSGIDQYSTNIIGTNSMIKFICEDCIMYIHNVDHVLKDMQDSVNKNKGNLAEYKTEFQDSLKKHESEIKNLLETIESRYMDRLSYLISAQKSCEKNLTEIQKICSSTKNVENQNKKICEELINNKNNNEKIYEEVKKIVNNNNNKEGTVTYSEAVKRTSNENKHSKVLVLPELKKDVPLILKPKGKQGSEKTKEDLNKKVDPKNLKISNIETKHNGVIIIESENNTEREKIKAALEKTMCDNYEVRVPNVINPRFIITSMVFKHEDEEIVEKLKKQNQVIESSHLKLVKYYEVNRNNKKLFNAILETDADSFPKILRAEKLNIGWERCKVYDGIEVPHCYKCKGFNHKAVDCKNDEVCMKCFEKHKTSECNKEAVIKCINCVRANNKLKLGLNENHSTYSKLCPVYQNKLDTKKKKLGISNQGN